MEGSKKVILKLTGDREPTTLFPDSPVGYKIDDPEYPGCLKLWWGRKTFIIPLNNLLMFEIDT